MRLNTVEEIENAIGSLTPNQLSELYSWLDRTYPQVIDTRFPQDLASGRLDAAILRALNEERSGDVRPL